MRTKTTTDICNRMLAKITAQVAKEKDMVQHGKMKAIDMSWSVSFKNIHKAINF